VTEPVDPELPGTSERAVAWYRRRAPGRRAPLVLAVVLTLAGATTSAVGLARVDALNPHLRHAPAHLVGIDAAPVTGEHANVSELPAAGRFTWFAAGLGLLLLGAATAIVQLRRELVREEYLLLHTEGFSHLRGGQVVEVGWDEVESVTYDPEKKAVSLRMRGYEEGWLLSDRFIGVDGPTLARRMEEVRRKASFGLLPEQRPAGGGAPADQKT